MKKNSVVSAFLLFVFFGSACQSAPKPPTPTNIVCWMGGPRTGSNPDLQITLTGTPDIDSDGNIAGYVWQSGQKITILRGTGLCALAENAPVQQPSTTVPSEPKSTAPDAGPK